MPSLSSLFYCINMFTSVDDWDRFKLTDSPDGMECFFLSDNNSGELIGDYILNLSISERMSFIVLSLV